MKFVCTSGDPGVEMALRLRRACEAHESELSSHLENVARFSCQLAALAGLPKDRIEQIRYAAPLHDVGKLGIPASTLTKSGPLSPDEMEIVKQHTTIGREILLGSSWPVIQCAERIAYSHHEFWDGSGYPEGLHGEDIPLEARIVAVADVFDALLSQRSYKPAWSHEHVLAEMWRLGGIKFDPFLLETFLGNLPKIEASAAA